MPWLAALLLRVGELGPWGPILFALLYIVAAVTMAPAFLLSVAAGALFDSDVGENQLGGGEDRRPARGAGCDHGNAPITRRSVIGDEGLGGGSVVRAVFRLHDQSGAKC